MTDVVHYRLPGGIFGTVIHLLCVRRQPERIFEFRAESIFGLSLVPQGKHDLVSLP